MTLQVIQGFFTKSKQEDFELVARPGVSNVDASQGALERLDPLVNVHVFFQVVGL